MRGGRERGGRRTRLREKLCSTFFLFLDRCKVFQSDRRRIFHEGTGILFFFPFCSVSFSLFLRCCCAGQCSLFRTTAVHTASMPKEEKGYPTSGMCTYVRHVSERKGRRTSGNRPRREAYVASELFSPEAWRQDSGHYQVASLQLRSIMTKNYIQPWTSVRLA